MDSDTEFSEGGMRRFRLAHLLVVWSVLIPICHGQITPPAVPPTPPPAVAWTEHYRKATISFGQIKSLDGSPAFEPVGTGVLVCTDERHAFVVTAKHIFYDPARDWFPASLAVRFSSQEKQTFTEQLGTPIQLTDANHKNYWSFPSDSSDIAAIALPESFRGLVTDCIGFQDFATVDDVYDGATVFTFGYPSAGNVIAGPNGLVRAITRSGVIAWTDPAGVLEYPLLLDMNILPGNSGGPAFKVPSGIAKNGTFAIGGRVAFLGIVTEGLVAPVSIGDRPLQVQTPGSLLPSTPGVIGVGALGRVEPAAKIRELVSSLATH